MSPWHPSPWCPTWSPCEMCAWVWVWVCRCVGVCHLCNPPLRRGPEALSAKDHPTPPDRSAPRVRLCILYDVRCSCGKGMKRAIERASRSEAGRLTSTGAEDRLFIPASRRPPTESAPGRPRRRHGPPVRASCTTMSVTISVKSRQVTLDHWETDFMNSTASRFWLSKLEQKLWLQ